VQLGGFGCAGSPFGYAGVTGALRKLGKGETMNDRRNAYTLAMWRVREGREEEFVNAWRGELAAFFLGLPNPPQTGTLIRSVEDPRLFYSFGPWRGLGDVREMRSHPRTTEVMGNMRELCEEVEAGDFLAVLTIP
jgi:hypothetical protein